MTRITRLHLFHFRRKRLFRLRRRLLRVSDIAICRVYITGHVRQHVLRMNWESIL